MLKDVRIYYFRNLSRLDDNIRVNLRKNYGVTVWTGFTGDPGCTLPRSNPDGLSR